jgi:hypothetical protein
MDARTAREKYETSQGIVLQLERQNETLRAKNAELSRNLETERTNADMLKRAFLDAEFPVDIIEEPEEAVTEGLPLPEGRTNVISGMPYTTITNKQSEQWALQLQAFTGKYGIRSYFDGDRTYFLAAMGSAYGREIGTAFRVTLKCGTEMYVMLGEFKDDGTDPNFFGHPTKHADGYGVTCVLEFIYDAEHIDSKALQAGNFCNIEHFGGLHGYGGDIVKIEYLERKWEP